MSAETHVIIIVNFTGYKMVQVPNDVLPHKMRSSVHAL